MRVIVRICGEHNDEGCLYIKCDSGSTRYSTVKNLGPDFDPSNRAQMQYYMQYWIFLNEFSFSDGVPSRSLDQLEHHKIITILSPTEHVCGLTTYKAHASGLRGAISPKLQTFQEWRVYQPQPDPVLLG